MGSTDALPMDAARIRTAASIHGAQKYVGSKHRLRQKSKPTFGGGAENSGAAISAGENRALLRIMPDQRPVRTRRSGREDGITAAEGRVMQAAPRIGRRTTTNPNREIAKPLWKNAVVKNALKIRAPVLYKPHGCRRDGRKTLRKPHGRESDAEKIDRSGRGWLVLPAGTAVRTT